MIVRITATVALLGLLPLGSAPRRLSQTPRPARWVLLYPGSRGAGRPAYTIDELTRLVAVVDTAGRPQRSLFSGAIFLHLFAPSGHVFTTWIGGTLANGADWTTYLDSLFAAGGAFQRLDSALALVAAGAGPSPGRFAISVMVPYPDPKSGTLRYRDTSYDFTTDTGRLAAAAAFVDDVHKRFGQGGFHRLRLDGCYWLNETVPDGDTVLVKGVAKVVHGAGLHLLWIPYYGAKNQTRWRELGFDEAWLQPNFFFHRDVAATRLDSAAVRALGMGMGLELEFDNRLLADPGFGDRLEPYLATLAANPALRAHSIAMYEGGGALIRLSQSRSPADRERYRRLVEALR